MQKCRYEVFERFIKCIKTGMDNPESSLGCYGLKPTDYSDFSGFFDMVIRDYHGDTSGEKKHVTSWETKGKYDVKEFGLENLSMRVRVGRNLVGTNLPGMMTKEDRIEFEKKMGPAFEQLISKYGGKVISLSPDLGPDTANKNLISKEEYQRLVNDHVMFKDMSADPYLNSAGISNDWPYGRGCWQSEDKSRIIWFGEEDQLRIMCMENGTDLLSVFKVLKEMLSVLESIDGIEFAKDENYGYITSCPSNLGTGMRASVHVKVPHLTADGSDDNVKIICKKIGLSVRGIGGEHTPIGKDGTVDISPTSRLFVTEAEVISSLYTGIKTLTEIEGTVTGFVKSAEKDSLVNTDDTIPQVKEGDNIFDSSVERIDNISVKTSEVAIVSKSESRDDNEAVNFVLIEDNDRQHEEKREQSENIVLLKEQSKKKSLSVMMISKPTLLPEMKTTRSMSVQTPSELKLSPCPILAIKNE
jgi:protein-arginine kinase